MPTIVVGTNSYETRVEADTYLESSVRAALLWAGVDPTTKDRALITAFRTFEREFTLIDPATGLEIDKANAPQDVKDAQSEYAFELTQNPALDTAESTGSNQKRLRAGTASIEFFRPTEGLRFPKAVQTLLAPFIQGDISAAVGQTATGTGCPSHFSAHPEGITEGFK